MTITQSPRPLAVIASEAAEAARDVTQGHDPTARRRDVAECFVEAREHFYTADGTPDWLGRTFAYRQWVRGVISEANVPEPEVATFLAAIRHHASNALRERLPEEEVARLGLRKSDARERSVEKRQRQTEVLSAFRGGPAISSASDVVAALQRVETMLRRVDVKAVRRLPKARRAEVAAALAAVAEHAAGIATEVSAGRNGVHV